MGLGECAETHSVIKWLGRDICGSHTLMDTWVSTHSFYQLISGSSSNGIIAIILYYKYQTIYFCWDSYWQLLLPEVIFFSICMLKKLQESVSFFQHLNQLNHMKLRIKAFQKKILDEKNKIISFLLKAKVCWKKKTHKKEVVWSRSCSVFHSF